MDLKVNLEFNLRISCMQLYLTEVKDALRRANPNRGIQDGEVQSADVIIPQKQKHSTETKKQNMATSQGGKDGKVLLSSFAPLTYLSSPSSSSSSQSCSPPVSSLSLIATRIFHCLLHCFLPYDVF